MTNQMYMAEMPPEDFYEVMNWLLHEHGRQYVDTRREAISWLYREARFGVWQRVTGYATPGGDPVWKCPVCGFNEHVYGIEHPSERRVFCKHCGTFNNYFERKEREDASDSTTPDA